MLFFLLFLPHKSWAVYMTSAIYVEESTVDAKQRQNYSVKKPAFNAAPIMDI